MLISKQYKRVLMETLEETRAKLANVEEEITRVYLMGVISGLEYSLRQLDNATINE